MADVTTLATEQGANRSHGVSSASIRRNRAAADCRRNRRGALGVDVGDQDLGAVAGEVVCKRGADVSGALDQDPCALDAVAAVHVLDRSAGRGGYADGGPGRRVIVVTGDICAGVAHRLQVVDACAHVHTGEVGAAGASHELAEALHQRAPVDLGRWRDDHGLGASERQPGERVLESHRRSESLCFDDRCLVARIGDAAHAAKSGAERGVVNRDRRAQSDGVVPAQDQLLAVPVVPGAVLHVTCLLRRNPDAA